MNNSELCLRLLMQNELQYSLCFVFLPFDYHFAFHWFRLESHSFTSPALRCICFRSDELLTAKPMFVVLNQMLE